MDETEKMDESVKIDKPDIEDYNPPHSGVRRRQGGGKMRSGLIATEFIPCGTHLAYHLTQDVDLFVNATANDTTGVWEAFSVHGAVSICINEYYNILFVFREMFFFKVWSIEKNRNHLLKIQMIVCGIFDLSTNVSWNGRLEKISQKHQCQVLFSDQ